MLKRYLVIVFLLLTGCEPVTVEDKFEDYLQRISNVQQQQSPALDLPRHEYPRKRDLYIEPPRHSVGLMDSLQLSECQLLSLIAERNTVLGKVQDQFRNLEYQVNLLSGLKECIDSNELDADFASEVYQIYQAKWQELPIHISNTLYTSDAMYANAYSNLWYSKESNRGLIALRDTLKEHNQLNQMHQQGDLMQGFSILSLQEEVEKFDQMGRITKALQESSYYLSVTTAQLKAHDHEVFCGLNRDPTRYQRLKNVFYTYYIAEIQPYLADLNSAYQTLSPYLSVLYTKNLPEHLQHPILNAYKDYKVASVNHAQYWITLFERCGDRVGRQEKLE